MAYVDAAHIPVELYGFTAGEWLPLVVAEHWRHLSENEAEELHDLIDMIDVDAILKASTR